MWGARQRSRRRQFDVGLVLIPGDGTSSSTAHRDRRHARNDARGGGHCGAASRRCSRSQRQGDGRRQVQAENVQLLLRSFP